MRPEVLKSRVSSKGQIVLPKAVRERLGLREGTNVTVRVEGDEVILRRVSPGSWKKWEGAFKGAPLVQDLLDERARERERDRRLAERLGS